MKEEALQKVRRLGVHFDLDAAGIAAEVPLDLTVDAMGEKDELVALMGSNFWVATNIFYLHVKVRCNKIR